MDNKQGFEDFMKILHPELRKKIRNDLNYVNQEKRTISIDAGVYSISYKERVNENELTIIVYHNGSFFNFRWFTD